MSIVRLALDRPYTFIVLAILILIAAPVVILRTPTDIFPNINIPVVSVAWQYTGLNPEELEGRLTTPYEKALTNLVDIRDLPPGLLPIGVLSALARLAYALTGPAGRPLWLTGEGEQTSRPDEPAREIRSHRRLLAVVGFGAVTASRPALLADVLREAHLPLELARSRIEVRAALAETEASRARLVRAGYEERRRLERDLHDGAQQRLVAIGMSLRLAQRHLTPGLASATLDEAVAELRLWAAEQGISPSEPSPGG